MKMNKYIHEAPKPIDQANLDGTKYVVYDPHLGDWFVGYFDMKLSKWLPFIETTIPELNPTHFTQYYGWDVIS